jgi:hypothetical protein
MQAGNEPDDVMFTSGGMPRRNIRRHLLLEAYDSNVWRRQEIAHFSRCIVGLGKPGYGSVDQAAQHAKVKALGNVDRAFKEKGERPEG